MPQPIAEFFQSEITTLSQVTGLPCIDLMAFLKTIGSPSKNKFALPLPMINRGTPAIAL
jgi:hypothetical protein